VKKPWFKTVLALCGVLLLILDSKTAIKGAVDGITLCLQVVIPSLFPFFVLINLLNSSLLATNLSWLSPMERLLRIPQGCGSIWLCGMLGGYPTGAQLVHSAWKQGSLRKKTADRMLIFCSNAGPAFLFGIVAAQFDNRAIVWWIWGIHIISSILVAGMLKSDERFVAEQKESTPLTFIDALKKSILVISHVCGWIVLFRVLILFCSRWFLWLLPSEASVLIVSILELANGATFLRQIENEGMRMLIATIGVNFGGLCVLMQTASVTSGLKLSNYLKGKMLQTLFSIVLSLSVLIISTPDFGIPFLRLWLMTGVIFVVILIYLLKIRKITVAFRRNPLYNLLNDKRKG